MKKLILFFFTLLFNATTAWAQFGPPSGPIADFVEITGTLEVGEILTGSYEYNDPSDIPEDGSTYQWYRLESEFDPPVLIDGATSETYTLTPSDAGKLMVFEVTPSNGTETGMPTPSNPGGPVGASSSGGGGNTAPVASNVSFSGTLEVGTTLTGSYDYSDGESDAESSSLYTWYRSNDGAGTGKTPIGGADSNTYTLVEADEGKYISFSVIPSDGTDLGTQVESSLQGPVLAESPSITFAGGSGIEADPYQIATLEQFQAMKDSPSSHYILNNDIDASATSTWNSGAGFVPIGGDSPFTGNFDGQGFVITGLTIDRPTEDYVGLFAVIGNGGSVSNIGLAQLSVTGGANTGGLAGESNGSISGSYVSGSVEGSTPVGGLVALNNANITSSYSAGTVAGTQDVGGLVGLHSLGTISKSYSTSDVTGSANNVGGLIGFAYDNVENSFATGSVSGDTNVGGFAGNYNSGTVNNSFSAGSVTGSTNVGGFIGQKNSFAAASNSFWDTEASGQASATGIGSTTGITGKTTAEMQTESTYTGWDFTDTWAIDAGENSGYPIQQDYIEEAVNSSPTGSVTISGTAQEDETLTASNTLADEDGLGAITYQWQRGGVNIVGATNSTYTLVQDDVGEVITVVASYTDGEGTAESETSAGTDVVISSNTSPEVTNAIADFTVIENAQDSLIDLTNVFSDIEDNDADLTYSVISNSNPTLVSITVNQTTDILTLNFQTDQIGTVDVTIRATDSDGLTADDSFKITVDEELSLDPLTAFITTWRTTSPNESITLYTTGGADISDFDAYIDWGDGTIEQITGDDPDPSHEYATSGEYEVRVYGVFPHLDNSDNTGLSYGETQSSNAAKLIAINQWGDIAWESMENMFYQTPNLVTYEATDTPDLSLASSLEGMFAFTGLTTSDLSGWDVSSITDFSSMFSNATSFNGDVSGWTFSSAPFSETTAINFTGMFNLASSFTGTGVAGWNVGNADSLTVMFSDAAAFNQDLSGWNVSNVKDMFLMADGTGLSTVNYTSMLTAWSVLSVQNNVDLGVGEATYTIAGLSGREALVDTYGWTISDGGLTAGALSLSTTEVSPIDTTVTDTLWMDLTIDGTVATDALNPGWTLTPATGLAATGTPVYNETRQQWGYDLSGISVSELEQEYALDISASVSLENGASSVDDNFSINITVPNTAPIVVNTIGDFSINEDATLDAVDLTIIFSDAEENDADLTYSVSNSNPAILSASIDPDNKLVLTLVADSSGTAELTIQAEDSKGLTAQNTFTLTIDPVNDAPTVSTPIADVMVDENAANTIIDLSTNFSDVETASGSLIYTIEVNDNPMLVTATISDSALTLNYQTDQFGVANITVRASDGELSVEDSFVVNVNEANHPPVFVETYDLSTAIQTNTVEGIDLKTDFAFNNDGTKLFILNGDPSVLNIEEHNLSIPFDLSTAIFSKDFSVHSEETAPNGFTFSKDGSKMYVIGSSTKDVEVEGWDRAIPGLVEYQLSIPFDISTSSFTGTRIIMDDLVPIDVHFSRDGKSMFILESQNIRIASYSLNTAFVLSTASANRQYLYTDPFLQYPKSIDFSADGKKLLVLGSSGTIEEFKMEEPFDLATVTHSGFDEALDIGSSNRFTFNNEGTRLFVSGGNATGATVYSLEPGTPNSILFTESRTETVIDVNANDGNGGVADVGLTYSISGGADADLFNIDSSTGNLTFKVSPDYDNPADQDGNNKYEVTIQADDGEDIFNTATILLTITVTNENEAPVVSSPLSNLVVDETDPNTTINLNNVFFDTEGNSTLNYSAESSNPAIVYAGIVSEEPTLILSYKEFGTATITVTASDGEFSVADTFNVTVNEVLSVDPANAFITTWTTTTTDEIVTIPTSGGAEISDFEFIVDWGDGSIERITGDDPDPSHTYATAGTHTVQIEGTFPYMNAGSDGDLNQLSSIEQWGNNTWENMVNTFAWARNLEYNATDAPDLSGVTSTAGMFFAAEKVNGDFSDWNTSTITDMSFMFDGATIFNGNITTWDVSNVTNMQEMFQNADAFNQDLSNWNVSSVKNMQGLFQDTDSFNGDVSTWKPSATTNMFGMFANAASFNQDVSGWDVSNVTDFGGMFLNAASFDQDISDWDISSATRLDNGNFGFLQGTSFSQQNYDMLLHKWNQLANLPENLSLNVGTAKYGPASAAHGNLTGFKGWTLTDGGRYNMFISIWEVTSEKPTIQLGAKGGDQISDFDFTIDWGDGTIEKFTGDTPIISHTYTEFGTKNIRIAGVFPEMNASVEGATIANIRSVVLWGEIQWESMASMFAGADNLELRNLDTPDLSSVTSMEKMFLSSNAQSSFNSDISDWDVSGITNMELMFAGAKAFNQNISGWDVGSVTNMGGMFASTTAFDQNLGNWNIRNVEIFDYNGPFGPITVPIDIGFMLEAGLSTSNYDSTLIGWAEQVTASTERTISFGDGTRSIISASSYNSLTDLGWTINDGGSAAEFTTRWLTTSSNETVTIPTGGGTEISDFDFTIDWGDGTLETFTGDDPDPSHTYATAGTHTVMIGGVFPHMDATQDGNLDQLVSLESWGSIKWESMTRMFSWARNMEYNATDTPDLSAVTDIAAMFFAAEKMTANLNDWDVSGVTNMSFMFDGATSFNGDITEWNTSNVTTMRDMFQGASSFNQDISSWDVSKVTDLRNMLNNASAFDQNLGDWKIGSVEFMQAGSQGFLEGTALSIVNYDSLLIKWSEQTLPMNLTLDVDSTYYSRRSVQSRQKIIDDFNWTIIDGGIGLSKVDLIVRKDRFSADSVLVIDVLGDDVPLSDREANFSWTAINLADSSNITGFVAPSFNADSTYWELITRGIKLNYTTGVNFNISVEVEIPELSVLETGKDNVELYNNFYLAENGVTIKAPNAAINEQGFVIIDGEPVVHTRRDRAGLDSLLSDGKYYPELTTAVTTGITDMSRLFYGYKGFDQPIGSWDVSDVTTMEEMFSGPLVRGRLSVWTTTTANAPDFNQDIRHWDVSSVVNMRAMFQYSTKFDQPIGEWDVSSVTDMSKMFASGGPFVNRGGVIFNQNISSWDVSSVTDMSRMFGFNYKFNQPIGDWNVSSVKSMRFMFAGAVNFNQPIGDWDVSNVTDFENMFWAASNFNQPIGDWDVSSVQDMQYMFSQTKFFDQPIGSWNVSNVERMDEMFEGAIRFNQPIGSWNVSRVYDFGAMFAETWLFNQDISSWDMSSAQSTHRMFDRALSFNNGNTPGQKTKTVNGVEVTTSLDWDVSNVTNMASMFQGAESFNQDISNWDVSNVKYFDTAPAENSDTATKEAVSSSSNNSEFQDDQKAELNLNKYGSLTIDSGQNIARQKNLDLELNKAENTQGQVGPIKGKMATTELDSIAGFLVGSGMTSANASKMFVEWSKRPLQDGASINIGKIELNNEGAVAMKALRVANNLTVAWGGEEGVIDEPVFTGLPTPYEVQSEDTRILKLWDYVSDVATPDNELKFKFSIDSDSTQTIGFDTTSGELAITAPAYADTFFVAIQVANNENIVSLDTLEVRTSPLFTSAEEMYVELPATAELKQNYPNPFNPSTIIRYGVPQTSKVRLEIFDLLGRKVATLVNNEQKNAGWHQVNFDASHLASGIYLYRIVAGDYVKSHRMTLIK
ncbi:MAG: BspA family leucine-rich repeat surface protein [Balneola sp.]